MQSPSDSATNTEISSGADSFPYASQGLEGATCQIANHPLVPERLLELSHLLIGEKPMGSVVGKQEFLDGGVRPDERVRVLIDPDLLVPGGPAA